MTFLEKVLQTALDTVLPEQLSQCLFLFPNKRASLFFLRLLEQNKHRPDPMLMPTLLTLPQWIADLSALQTPSSQTLLLELYRAYRTVSGDAAWTFAAFYPWSRVVLRDLQEIDSALLDEDALRQISEVCASDNGPSSPFSHLLSILPRLHEQFNAALLTKKWAHYPLALKQVLSESACLDEALALYPAVFVAGFYPIDTAELSLFKKFKKHEKVHLLWDGDSYFINHPGQEAAELFKNSTLFPSDSLPFDNDLKERPRTITLLETQGSVSQAKALGQVLAQTDPLPGQEETDTALVLLDEQMLTPLLSAMPEQLSSINITMGYPLAHTLVAALFKSIEELHKSIDLQADRVLFAPLHTLLCQPAWAPLLSPQTAQELVLQQKQQTRAIPREQAILLMGSMPQLLTPPQEALALFSLLLDLLERLKEAGLPTDAPHPLELMFQFRKHLLALNRLCTAPDLSLSVEVAWQILWETVGECSLPFYGEPLQGLQIMGMLETRCLDFKNLLILACNEGVYPQNKAGFSLIPFEIRQRFHLRTHRELEAQQAYYFYRLLKRAERVWLIYDSAGSVEKGGEASRFIQQIRYELQNNCPLTRLESRRIRQAMPMNTSVSIAIANHEQLRNRWLAMNFSASALNTFLECPLRFYYRYGCKMEEASRNQNEIDPRSIGLIAHQCLHLLYEPYIGQTINAHCIEAMLSQINPTVEMISQKNFPGQNTQQGRPFLESRILIELLEQLLSAQRHEEPFFLQGLEKQLRASLQLDSGQTIHFTGIIDRIDKLEKSWRIVDYKSGLVQSLTIKDEQMPKYFTPDHPFMKRKIVWQMLLYRWLFNSTTLNVNREIICTILSLKKPQDGHLALTTQLDAKEILGRFITLLKEIFTALNHPQYIFKQCVDPSICLFCPYINCCHR